MRPKLSIHQKVLCGVIVVCTGFAYLLFCLVAIGGAWQRKEGDLPPVSPWVEDASLAIVAFPFGIVPGLGDMFVAPFLNGLFWSAVAGVIYVWILRRKVA